MNDRLGELQSRVSRSRAALEALADRAAALRARFGSAKPLPPAPALTLVEDAGEDGKVVADAWEIALINEEGK